MYSIREADITDVATIRHIAHETWWPAYSSILSPEQITYMLATLYSEETIGEQISTGGQTYILLMEAGIPVAFAAYSPRTENPDVYKLYKLYCLPQTQGKGYGKIIIDEVCQRVLSQGKNILDLNVNRYNKAKSFYQKLGFNIISEEDIPIGNYWMNDYVMRKEL